MSNKVEPFNIHCIAETRAYWVETKPFQIDNPRHHYQIACWKIFKRFFKSASVEKSRVSFLG